MKKIALTTFVAAGILNAHGFGFGGNFNNCMPFFKCNNGFESKIEKLKEISQTFDICMLESATSSELNSCNNNFMADLDCKKFKMPIPVNFKKTVKKFKKFNTAFNKCLVHAANESALNMCKSNVISKLTNFIPLGSSDSCSNNYEPVYALKDGIKQVFANKCVAKSSGAMFIGFFNHHDEKPTMCTSEYKPVYALKCHTLKEYSNKCMALKDGAIYIADKFNNNSDDCEECND